MNGALKRIHNYWTDEFRQWEQSEGQDVTIYIENQTGYRRPYLCCVYIDENPDHWVNRSVKKYYGLNSIRGVYYQTEESTQ